MIKPGASCNILTIGHRLRHRCVLTGGPRISGYGLEMGILMDGIEGGEVQGNGPGGDGNAPGPNPAWSDVLGIIPEQYHAAITPHFQKWDQSAQSRIEQANSQVQAYEGFKPFIEHGIDPQELENGLRLMYEINNNPQNVYNALGQAYSLGNTPGNDDGGDGEDDGTQNYQDPRYDTLQQNLELVNQIILQDHEAKEAAKADAELDHELSGLKQKFGDIDERYVLAMMQNGMTGEQAAQSFQEFRNGLLQSNPRPFAPNVMGGSQGGAGYPSQQVDPTKLSGKETRGLVEQMLRAAAQQQ